MPKILSPPTLQARQLPSKCSFVFSVTIICKRDFFFFACYQYPLRYYLGQIVLTLCVKKILQKLLLIKISGNYPCRIHVLQLIIPSVDIFNLYDNGYPHSCFYWSSISTCIYCAIVYIFLSFLSLKNKKAELSSSFHGRCINTISSCVKDFLDASFVIHDLCQSLLSWESRTF